ncbi:MAG: HipA N-terminal domain-containing protein, partial [Rickettsiales bacterium]|nr:HipA N-terminal domain-containing protein [Rickettsiales bacterium]
MANSQWGNVFISLPINNNYEDIFVGRLQEDPSGRYIFTYDESYLTSGNPHISYTLPLRREPYISEAGLHPFFDNLVAEGWFGSAQARSLGADKNNHFALLLGYGHDLA